MVLSHTFVTVIDFYFLILFFLFYHVNNKRIIYTNKSIGYFFYFNGFFFQNSWQKSKINKWMNECINENITFYVCFIELNIFFCLEIIM